MYDSIKDRLWLRLRDCNFRFLNSKFRESCATSIGF